MWGRQNNSSCLTLVLFWGGRRDGHACLQGDPTPVVELEDEVPGPWDPILTWWKNTDIYQHIKDFYVSTEQLDR